jgi:hypothetical protein
MLWLLVFSSPVVWYVPSSHGFVCFHILGAEFLGESSVVVAWWSCIVLVSVCCGRFLLLHLFWMIVFLGQVSKVWSYFHSVPKIPHFLVLLAFKVSAEKYSVILMDLPLYRICFSSLTIFNILSLFSVLLVLMGCLTKIFSLISILSLSSEILSLVLVCWSGLLLYFCLTKGTFCFQDFCLIIFSEVFHIFVQLLFYILCCHL